MAVWYGIDIGGTSAKTALIDEAGQIVSKQTFETGFGTDPKEVARLAAAALAEQLERLGLARDDVLAAGAGIPGFLDYDLGVVVEAVNLHWNNVPFASLLKEELGIPVTMENDANVAALGEAFAGAGKGHQVVVCVTVGTGVGGGIVIDGKLHRGVSGMAGEIGHLVVKREDGYLCNCGNRGCLETVSSATAIVRNARKLQESGEIPGDIKIDDAKDVFNLAASGNTTARQVVRAAASWLGYALSLVAVTLNPDAIVVGGGVSKAHEQFLNPMREAFAEVALTRVVEAVTIQSAALSNDAGVIGAGRLAQQLVS